MEDLNKQQLVLLTLLVSFVTSIGTGIITFTMLQEAPIAVTQTINRVVERTIEKVVPETGGEPQTITTVVINEEDRVLDAISKNEKSIVRLKTTAADGSSLFMGLGLVVSADGVIVADARSYSATTAYSIQFFDGKIYPIGKVEVDTQNELVFMKVVLPQNEKYTFYTVVLGNSDTLKIGQSLVAISGKESNAASIGRVFQLTYGDDKKTVTKITSDLKVSRVNQGSPILNLSGEVVGMELSLSESDSQYIYLPVNILKSATLKALEKLPS